MDMIIKNIDKDIKLKAGFVAKAKGSNLTEILRQKIDELAKEYDKKIIKNI